MASKIQSTNATLTAATGTKAFVSSVTAGSFLVCIGVANSSTLAISDNRNGAWTKITTAGSTSGAFSVEYLFIKANAAAGATTLTFTGTGSQAELEMMEFAGVDSAVTTANAFGVKYDSAGNTSAWDVATTSGSALTGDLGVCGAGDTNPAITTTSTTTTTNWVADQHSSNASTGVAFEYHDLAGLASGTITAHITFNNASFWPAIIATFTAAGGATFVPKPIRLIRQAVNRAGTY